MAFQKFTFGFPADPRIVPPSQIDDQIALQQRFTSFVLSGLVVSIVMNVLAIPLVVGRADVVPYVADGGVFGCQARTINAPVAQDLK